MIAFSAGCLGLEAAAEMLRLRGVCSSRHEALVLCFPLSHTAPNHLKKYIYILFGCAGVFMAAWGLSLVA